ncbi:MAG: hypothetical protein JWN23_1506 [Rhodocyclales bacterium]|nr:hypothetical protein [Rhodocyclales bacterium]
MIKKLTKVIALSAVICAMPAAHAVIGTGWTSASPSYKTQTEGCGSVSGLTFKLTCNTPYSAGYQRAERRYVNMTKSTQFEGTVKINSLTGDRISLKQTFQDGTGPWQMLGVKKSGSSLVLYEVEGGTTLGTLAVGGSVRVNTLTTLSSKSTVVYLNGTKVETKTGGKTPLYDKFGAYGTSSGYGPVSVTWSGVAFWTK